MPVPVEFSRRFAVDRLPEGGFEVKLDASEAERRALAQRFDLIELDSLQAEVRIAPVDGGIVRVAGHLHARPVQRCVVTLDPVANVVDADFERLFAPDLPEVAEGEVEIDPEADLPEPLAEDHLDLGEIVAEELSLALDPYPRSAEADQVLAGLGGDEDAGGRSSAGPFNALSSLRGH